MTPPACRTSRNVWETACSGGSARPRGLTDNGTASGVSEPTREELWKALDYPRDGDTLVVPSLDRLGRSLQGSVRFLEDMGAGACERRVSLPPGAESGSSGYCRRGGSRRIGASGISLVMTRPEPDPTCLQVREPPRQEKERCLRRGVISCWHTLGTLCRHRQPRRCGGGRCLGRVGVLAPLDRRGQVASPRRSSPFRVEPAPERAYEKALTPS
ncbi:MULTISPECIES: recombinase family protein [Nonomuraea]|uniref:Recombinase family protein n=1 Tax=Nonomuraea mangrovi TaxID=2316207 RepID=A0ABW4TF14_9ACTN